MIKQQAGVIVNVSSIATRGINRIPYSASKGGVNALTASLAFEHAKDGFESMLLRLVEPKRHLAKYHVTLIR